MLRNFTEEFAEDVRAAACDMLEGQPRDAAIIYQHCPHCGSFTIQRRSSPGLL